MTRTSIRGLRGRAQKRPLTWTGAPCSHRAERSSRTVADTVPVRSPSVSRSSPPQPLRTPPDEEDPLDVLPVGEVAHDHADNLLWGPPDGPDGDHHGEGPGGLGAAVARRVRRERLARRGARRPARGGQAAEVVAGRSHRRPAAVGRAVARGDGRRRRRRCAPSSTSSAGSRPASPWPTTPVEEFEAQFPAALRPTYLVTQAALPALVAAGGGAVVCVSSRSALHPFAGAAGYCASKAAVTVFAEVVAREHAADGVRCNAVLPKMIDTPANPGLDPPAEQHADLTPPEHVASVIHFLCSAGLDPRPTAPRSRSTAAPANRRRSASPGRPARASRARSRSR